MSENKLSRVNGWSVNANTMDELGWNDASVGPLIPYVEEFYHINYTTVATM